jgi:glutamate-ammonia-ligase adenylyltransferase
VTAFFERISERPRVYDAARGEDVLATLAESLAADEALAPAGKLIAQTPKTRELLLATFSGSPYLASIGQRDPQVLADCLLKDPDRHFEEARAELAAAVAEAERSKDVSSLLRRFKQRVALLVGLADLGGVWPIETVIATMSVAADTALEQAVAFLFRQARAAGEIGPAPDGSDTAPGYFVIAMGKLGAFELNYSSDIDIIVFYDAERARLASEIEPNQFFVKITRELVRLMQEHTSDGYVFRTDLRLRPDPGATQIALSTDAGLTYYESFGQNWERAALIKARVVAGDVEAGESFLGELSPFIWRKYLDYPAIADIHAMKRRVHAFKGHDAIAVAGHDIKLGRGGIRDIEFFAQTQQLIAGGRHPELRTRGTLETLRGLAEGGWITREAADHLSQAYRFLRRVENRLQIVADQQTHVIPSDPPELDRIAALSGFADADGFAVALFAAL